MKKRITELSQQVRILKVANVVLATFLILSVLMNCVVYFKDGKDTKKVVKEKSESTSTFRRPKKAIEYNLADCVKKLGKYKGLTVTIDKDDDTLTKEDYADYVLSQLDTTYTLPAGEKIETGDLLKVNIEVTVDGQTFNGSSMTLPDYELGQDAYCHGVDARLTGYKVGTKEPLKFSMKLPEEFDPFDGETPEKEEHENLLPSDVAGKKADFKITLVSAERSIKYDHKTISDDILIANTSYKSVNEFMKYCEDFANDYNTYHEKQAKRTTLLAEIVENSDVEISQDVKDQELAIYLDQYTKMYASQYNSLQEYLEQSGGQTYEEFVQDSRERLDSTLVNLAISLKIAEEENATISKKEITNYVKDLVKGSSYEESSTDDVYSLYDSEFMKGEDFVKRMALSTKVLDSIAKSATFTYVESEDK